jgi:hypothetical protein
MVMHSVVAMMADDNHLLAVMFGNHDLMGGFGGGDAGSGQNGDAGRGGDKGTKGHSVFPLGRWVGSLDQPIMVHTS